jgi:large subunit ribosomal protein L28
MKPEKARRICGNSACIGWHYWYDNRLFNIRFMAKICELTGKGPRKGSIIWRSGKSKKSGGIGTHVTAITKRRFFPNLQRVKAILPGGEVRYVRVAASALKKGLVTKAPKRTWKKPEAKAEAPVKAPAKAPAKSGKA